MRIGEPERTQYQSSVPRAFAVVDRYVILSVIPIGRL
jgi:hypothetical protein